MCDNVTVISCINNMGLYKIRLLQQIAFNIRDLCIKKKLWISAAHNPGVSNKEAGKQSRILDDATDWQSNLK